MTPGPRHHFPAPTSLLIYPLAASPIPIYLNSVASLKSSRSNHAINRLQLSKETGGGGHPRPLESVKIKITTNNYEEPVSKSLLTRNTPMALLTHPFPSAPLCLASSSQESWQLQRRPTASASRCSSAPVLPSRAATPPAPAARPSLRVPAGSSFRPAQRRVTATKHRSPALRPGAVVRTARGKQGRRE